MKMIWTSFLLTLPVYGGVLHFGVLMSSEGKKLGPIIGAASTIALICAVAGQMVPKLLYASNNRTMANEPLIDRVYLPWILRLVLFEQVALIGFVLGFLTGNPNFYLPFFLLTLLGFLSSWPTPERLQAMME